jgi:hypothetical protein
MLAIARAEHGGTKAARNERTQIPCRGTRSGPTKRRHDLRAVPRIQNLALKLLAPLSVCILYIARLSSGSFSIPLLLKGTGAQG